MNASSSTTRLFLALWPDEAELAAVSNWQHAFDWPTGARLTPPKNVHATLHFIGQVPSARLPELETELAVPLRPFEVTFEQPELWGRGLAVLNAGHVPPALRELHAALGEKLLALGLTVETRTYRPHVTLARGLGPMLPPERDGQTPPGVKWRCSGYALVESAAGRYNLLARY